MDRSGLCQAFATARFAMTPIRCARYSALAWMSLFSPSGECRDSGDRVGRPVLRQRRLHLLVAEHAVLPRAGDRHAHAGRDPSPRTRRPSRSGKPDCETSRTPISPAPETRSAVISSSGSSAVVNMPWKKSSALMLAPVGLDRRAQSPAPPQDSRPRDHCWRASRPSCRDDAPECRRSRTPSRRGPGSSP